MKRRFALASLLAILFVLAGPASAQRPETGFLNRTVTVGGSTYRYAVYVPADWTPDRQWPVILFLHGAGERGDDGVLQTQVGLPGAIRMHVERFPAVVVIPQCRKNVWWQEPAMESQALAALDAASKEFHGDASRTYLTGLSMGGYGTWSLAAKYPGRWAAVAPVCGGIVPPPNVKNVPVNTSEDPYADAAKKVGNAPVWIFHGDADAAVPVTESRKMAAALKAAGNTPKYSEYPGIGHNSWDKAYNDPEFAAWLFAQKLSRIP